MRSFSDIIAAFGGVVPFRDAMGLPDVNARQMKQRDSIPAGYWPQVVSEAARLGVEGITLDLLAGIASDKLRDAKAKAEKVA